MKLWQVKAVARDGVSIATAYVVAESRERSVQLAAEAEANLGVIAPILRGLESRAVAVIPDGMPLQEGCLKPQDRRSLDACFVQTSISKVLEGLRPAVVING